MATSVHVKPKSKWKNVEFTKHIGTGNDFSGLICMEELTDYELLNRKPSTEEIKEKQTSKQLGDEKSKKEASKKQKKKDKKNKKPETQNKPVDLFVQNKTVSPDNMKEEVGIKKKTKKKKTKKKKGQVIKMSEVQDLSQDVLHGEKKERKRKRKKSKEAKQAEEPSVKRKKTDDYVTTDETKVDSRSPTKQVMSDLKSWKGMYVPEPVLRALQEEGFTDPTPIQTLALPHAIRDRLDIVGAAETGSGKTLAFGIPVIDRILKVWQEKEKEEEKKSLEKEESNYDENSDSEIDLVNSGDDVSDSGERDVIFDKTDFDCDDGDDNDDDDEVGEEDEGETEDVSGDEGIEEEEEDRVGSDNSDEDDGEFGCVKVVDDADFSDLDPMLLRQFEPPNTTVKPVTPPIALILEPTRELAVQVKNHLLKACRHTNIKIANIVGGLSQQKQQRILRKCPEIVVATPGRLWELVQQGDPFLSLVNEVKCLVVDEADRMIEKGHFQELSQILSHLNRDPEKKLRRQTFVFSATLTTLHTGPHRYVAKKFKVTEELKLGKLMKRIGLKERPKVIDLTRKVGTVETLTEARINCTVDEKDHYLYYFLKQYPGRTLLFANSKDCIRRLVSVLTLLETNPMPLHADMHQKQRLKNLEKFTANPKGLLLASDVAARGLDIPNVQHVIHYQVPHTVENYIHRSGRTARATKEGLSVMLVGQEDAKNYRKIISSLNRSEELPVFPVNYQILTVMKERVSLARQLDKLEHSVSKQKRQNDWFEKAAREMDMDLDENLLNDLGDSAQQARHRQKVQLLRAQLKGLLKTPVIPLGYSGKYPTRTGKLVLPEYQDKEIDAIGCVKKDKKSQQKMMEKIRLASLSAKPPPEKKKKKWKKKSGK